MREFKFPTLTFFLLERAHRQLMYNLWQILKMMTSQIESHPHTMNTHNSFPVELFLIITMTSQIKSWLLQNRFHNTKTQQKECKILCWRLLKLCSVTWNKDLNLICMTYCAKNNFPGNQNKCFTYNKMWLKLAIINWRKRLIDN